MVFEDRREAGQRLAALLEDYRLTDSIVLAIPRGGVEVGFEVARTLGLPLDVVVPRKLGAPGEPELAIGAVAAWGDHEAILDDRLIRYLGVPTDYIAREIESQIAEIERRLIEYRGDSAAPVLRGKTVIVVDDGIATGYTLQAAVIGLRRLKPKKLVAAVPVAAPEGAETLSKMADAFYAVETPSPFLAVGHWYRNFEQTTDEEVVGLLKKRREDTGSAI
jgi:putative phosphoribosyl transferase